MKLTICGIDPWNGRCKDAKHLKAIVIARYAAHPSTQHLNERLVKIASCMSRTGKIDRTANYYLIASNDFITESIYEGLEELEGNEGDNEQLGCGYKRKRGHLKGVNKLIAIEKHLEEIEIDHSALCDLIGGKEFNKEVKLVTRLLANVDSIKQE